MAKEDTPIMDLSNAKVNRMLRDYIKSREGLHWVEIRKSRDQRTLAQNAYYWSCVLPPCAERMTELWGEDVSVEDVHFFFKKEFLSRPIVDRETGEVKITTVQSSAFQDTLEFAKYLEKIIRFAGEQLEIGIPEAKRKEDVDEPART